MIDYRGRPVRVAPNIPAVIWRFRQKRLVGGKNRVRKLLHATSEGQSQQLVLLPFIVFIPAKSRIFGDVTNSLDVHHALHRHAICGDCDEIISFRNCRSVALATESAAPPTTRSCRRRARWILGRTKIDFTCRASESAGTSASLTRGCVHSRKIAPGR